MQRYGDSIRDDVGQYLCSKRKHVGIPCVYISLYGAPLPLTELIPIFVISMMVANGLAPNNLGPPAATILTKPSMAPTMLWYHDGGINCKYFPRYCGALVFSLICAWTNVWANHRDAGGFRRHRAHYEVIVMTQSHHKLYREACEENREPVMGNISMA